MNQKIKYTFAQVILTSICLVYISACAPTKNTFTRRAYHNVTSHYNALFNGTESYKEAQIELNKVAEDDYSMILPMFKKPTAIQAQSVSSQLDKAIMKSSIVIQKHSFAQNSKTNKEYCKWIDDSYMLIGKSYFAKQDYRQAGETFDFVSKEYDTPLKYESLLWLVRSKHEQNKFIESLSMLDMISSKSGKKTLTKHTEQALPLIYAEYYIKQQQYPLAIEYLEKGIEKNKKRKVLYRLNYILAQIYQKNGELEKAGEFYHKVIKQNPPYVMAFNSRINMAKCFDGNSSNGKLIKNELQKMLRDGKNLEFFDQIYYTLGEISLKEKDTTDALGYFKKASAFSIKNIKQKAITLLTIADLYYIQLKYEDAQIYYDSSLQFLPKDYPNYTDIEGKKELLTKLVTNIKTIQLEDSLQRIANLPEKERLRAVEKIIEEITRKEEEEKQAQALKIQQLAKLKQESRENNADNLGTGGWYFYNTTAMSFGYNEFVKKWGKRQLEDLWRLKDKRAVDLDLSENNDNETENDQTDTTKTAVINLKDKNYYLKLLPVSDEAKKESNNKITSSMYNVGYIYYEGLSDYQKSATNFQILVKRFPESDFTVKAYYYLYKIYSDNIKDKSKADYYKNLILTKFPETDYAKILSNPDYYKELELQNSKQSQQYSKAYAYYTSNDFNQTIVACDEGIKLKDDEKQVPRFYYLKALSYAKLGNKDEMKKILTEIVNIYPKHNITPLAKNILEYDTNPEAYTDNLKPATPSTFKVTKDNEYTLDSSAIYLCIMQIDITRNTVNDFKNSLSDYNTKNYSLQNLTVSNIVLSKTIQLVTISNFKGIEQAMKYYNSIIINPDALLKQAPEQLLLSIISTSNYSTVVRTRNLGSYFEYFNTTYLHKPSKSK